MEPPIRPAPTAMKTIHRIRRPMGHFFDVAMDGCSEGGFDRFEGGKGGKKTEHREIEDFYKAPNPNPEERGNGRIRGSQGCASPNFRKAPAVPAHLDALLGLLNTTEP